MVRDTNSKFHDQYCSSICKNVKNQLYYRNRNMTHCYTTKSSKVNDEYIYMYKKPSSRISIPHLLLEQPDLLLKCYSFPVDHSLPLLPGHVEHTLELLVGEVVLNDKERKIHEVTNFILFGRFYSHLFSGRINIIWQILSFFEELQGVGHGPA